MHIAIYIFAGIGALVVAAGLFFAPFVVLEWRDMQRTMRSPIPTGDFTDSIDVPESPRET